LGAVAGRSKKKGNLKRWERKDQEVVAQCFSGNRERIEGKEIRERQERGGGKGGDGGRKIVSIPNSAGIV